MEMLPVNYDDLKQVKNKERFMIGKFFELFIESGHECVKVVDDENHYNNNNDLSAAFRMVLKQLDNGKYKDIIKIFMLNGEVYLKRK